MKRNRLSLILLVIFTLTSAGIAPTFSAVKPKSAGRTATTLPNTILNGKGAPISKLGIDGDFYIDTRSLSLYGPKKSGKWPSAQSLQGATGAIGAAGSDGRNGSDGRTTSNATSVTGPSGTQGERGEKGDAGAAGSSGLPGPAGPTGAKGDTGNSGGGPAGARGDTGSQGAAGATGAKGETGTAGSDGTDGSVGAAGAKGETGTVGNNGAPGSIGVTGAKGETGTVGPSNVSVGTFSYTDIQGGAGLSQSSSITGFKAGKNYVVRIKIITFQPDSGMDNSVPIGLDIYASGSTPIISSHYSVYKGNSYRGSPRVELIEYSADADVVINGSSSGDFSLVVTVIAGISTSSSNHLRVQGSYSAIAVGSVTDL
jgi:hypothetical protein